MIELVFAGCAVALLLSAGTWAAGSVVLWRRSRRPDPTADHDRTLRLAQRDAVVAVLILLVGLAAAARALVGDRSAADGFLLIAVLPTAALLPFLGPYRGHAELHRAEHDHRDHARLELLYEVAAAGEVLDVEVSASRMADALVPGMGDWAIVVLLDRAGEIEGMAVARADDETGELVEHLLSTYPLELDADVGIGEAIRTGERVRFDDITEEVLASAAQDETHLDMLRRLGLRSCVIEPVAVGQRRLGAIAVVSRGDRTIDDAAVELLAAVAEQAAPVLDNARLHRDLIATERSLRFSEAVLRAQGESGVEGLLVVGPDGQLLSYNSRFVDMWQLDRDLLGQGSDEAALRAAMESVVDPEAFLETVRTAYADRTRPWRDEVEFLDGRVFDRYGAPLDADDGNFLGWAWYFRDITEERRIEASLRESSARFSSLARTLQESLLPPDMPTIDGVDVAARYHPAGDGSEIGGDFYDVFQIDDQEWCAVMGDVCGKGAPAARLTALARYTLRAAAARSRRIERNLAELNAALVRQAERDRERDENRFVTAAVARFRATADGVDVTVASAGHPPPLLVRSTGEVVELDCRGHLLGMFEEITIRPTTVHLARGDAIVLFTDGVTEARCDRVELGDEGLQRLLTTLSGSDADALAGSVESTVLDFQGGTARDDTAVLVIRAPQVVHDTAVRPTLTSSTPI